METAGFNLAGILNRLQNNHPVKKNEVTYLLGLSDPEETRLLFEAARALRARYFGSTIFLYGFLYFSTHCRNNCNFCQYRESNQKLVRYRKNQSEITAAARDMAAAGVHLIDLTMGEDPELYGSGKSGFSRLVTMVKAVQAETELPVMISPGALPDSALAQLADAGVTWFACYQETHNKTLYKTLRQGQGFQNRLAKKHLAKSLGMLIEEGLLTGVGESLDDLTDSILWMRDFSVDQARVMTFVPQADTPMAHTNVQESLKELVIIAVMRLVLQDVLIPASLDVDGLKGLRARLEAGANVVTSIVPPNKGLAGVANPLLDIEASRRTLAQVLPILKSCGLSPAPREEYLAWVTLRQKRMTPSVAEKEAMEC
ncbi:MAG: methylornithine synthase PylB [Desulfobacterium sp.]|jgi:methylornithine synthase|nr:methylornithine synthase PylB [Desulfobacterium sp.]